MTIQNWPGRSIGFFALLLVLVGLMQGPAAARVCSH